MKRAGWRGESYRHYLAAKHIRTGRGLKKQYFAETVQEFAPTPEPFKSEAQIKIEQAAQASGRAVQPEQAGGVSTGTRTARAFEELGASRLKERLAREQRADVKEYQDIAKTENISLLNELKNRTEGPAQKAAIQAKIDEIASKKVLAGAKLSSAELSAVSSGYQSSLRSEEALRARARSTFGQLREGFEEQLREGILKTKSQAEQEFTQRLRAGDIREKYMEERLLGEEGKRDFGVEGYYPNPVTNDTRKEPFYGAFNPFEIGESGYPVGSNPKGGQMEPIGELFTSFTQGAEQGQDGRPIPSKMMISKEVDAIHKGRKELAKADVTPYRKGVEAFEKGDREALVSAIVELEGQANALSSRRGMVNQTKVLVESEDHRVRSLRGQKDRDMMSFDWLNGSGAARLSEETRKVEEALTDIRNSQNKVLGRATDLKNKLQRMDSTLPPQTSLPQGVVKVFNEKGLPAVKNPVPNPLSFAEEFVTR